jgi:hypothetical protein
VKTSGTLITNTDQSGNSSNYNGLVRLMSGGTIKDWGYIDPLGVGTLDLEGGLLQNLASDVYVLNNAIGVSDNSTVSSRGARLKFAKSLTLYAGSTLDIYGELAVSGTIDGSGNINLDEGLLAVGGSNPDFSGNVAASDGTTIQVTTTAVAPLGKGFLVENLKKQGVLAAVVRIGDPVLENPLIVKGGTLIVNGQFSFPMGVTVDAGATLDIEGADSQVVISGPLAGSGNIVVGGGIFSVPGDSSFSGSVELQQGQVTPNLTVGDAGGIFNGSPFPATALLSAIGATPGGSLEGVSPTLTYYVGSTTTGTGSDTAPTDPGTYTVVAGFVGSTHYTAVQSDPVSFTIKAQVIEFSSASYRVSEKGKFATITVVRAGDTSKPVSISYATVPGTARTKTEYKPCSGTLNFAANQTTKTFAVQIIDDAVAEIDKTVGLLLANPTDTAVLGDRSAAVLTILDNDDHTPPTAKLLKLPVAKAGAPTYQFSVKYADNVLVNGSTIGTGDILITGPKRFKQAARMVSASPSGNSKSVTAVYRISAPGGAWDSSDNGLYAIWLQKKHVSDTQRNFAAKQQLGILKAAFGKAKARLAARGFVAFPEAPVLVPLPLATVSDRPRREPFNVRKRIRVLGT